MVASWIDLCLNNGYDFLGVNKKQKKPFLLYLLKTYGFEIFDKSLYGIRKDVITICRSIDQNDNSKMLLFKDLRHENNFIKTNIYNSDNYQIIHDCDGIITLDDIILPLQNIKNSPIKYQLFDFDLAKNKTLTTITKHKR